MRHPATSAVVLVACAAALGCSSAPSEDAASTTASPLVAACDEASILAASPASRRPILERGFAWIRDRVPYSQTRWHEGYRQDCSGFVSMCWSLGESRVTWTLAPYVNDVSHAIGWDELLPGDALNLNEGGTEHVVLFGGFRDAARSTMCVLEESRTGLPALVKEVGRGYFGKFHPIRSNTVDSNVDEPRASTYRGLAAGPSNGYWEAKDDGAIFAWGVEYRGGANTVGALGGPVVAVVSHGAGDGYWEIARDGAVYAFGSARYEGGANALASRPAPIVGAAATAGEGYWLSAADGAVFAFGDAEYRGGANTVGPLSAPIVGMAATSSGHGYWQSGADGAVYAFGDAEYRGGANALGSLSAPIVGMAATPSGHGYWQVGADGAVFAFGDAKYRGGANALGPLASPVSAIASTSSGDGYWLMAGDGAVYAFGDAPYRGGANAPR